MWPFKTKTTTAAVPIAQALKPKATQLDIVEDKLDYLIANLKNVKTVTVGVADETIADLKAQIQKVSDAVAAVNVPAVAPVAVAPVVVAPTVVPVVAAVAVAPVPAPVVTVG